MKMIVTTPPSQTMHCCVCTVYRSIAECRRLAINSLTKCHKIPNIRQMAQLLLSEPLKSCFAFLSASFRLLFYNESRFYNDYASSSNTVKGMPRQVFNNAIRNCDDSVRQIVVVHVSFI